VLGHTSACLYAVWSNPAPGVSAEHFREYYEDVHRPDTLAIGHFERSFRYEAQGACRARFLTLWEARYGLIDDALERVRKGAFALHERGRIWPVQEVVFHQFLFAPGPHVKRPPARGDADRGPERLEHPSERLDQLRVGERGAAIRGCARRLRRALPVRTRGPLPLAR